MCRSIDDRGVTIEDRVVARGSRCDDGGSQFYTAIDILSITAFHNGYLQTADIRERRPK